MQRVLSAIAILSISGCVAINRDYWTHEFDGVGHVEGDTIRVVQDSDSQPTQRWIAIRAYDLKGWFLMRCEAMPTKYDNELSTESGSLNAWFMKTPSISPRGEEFAWHLPEETFHRFREDPDHDRYRENVLPLEGKIQIRGDGNTVHRIDVNLRSRNVPTVRFDGSVSRRWRPIQLSFVLI